MLNISRSSVQWLMLFVLSAMAAWPFIYVGIGAGALVGPMLVGIAFGLKGARIGISGNVFVFSQGVLGLMIASMLQASVLQGVASHLGAMTVGIVMTLLGATATGWVLTRYGALPGSTGVWGSLPGAASAMVSMSAAFGADPRLVAVMQYLRVLMVVLAATAVSHYAVAPGAVSDMVSAATVIEQPSASLTAQALSVLLALLTAWLGAKSRLPAGALLAPIIIGGALQVSEIFLIALPRPLIVLSFAILGWSIGLRFTRDLIMPMLRALPIIFIGIIALLVLCMLAAWTLTLLAPVSLLTAYLATSPGGLDSVAVLAMQANADMPFVVAFQTLRLFSVVLVGPFVGRWLTKLAAA